MTRNVRPFSDFIWLLAGPIVWAAHFFLVYGVEAVICTRAASPSVAMRWIIVAATAVALGVLFVLVLRLMEEHEMPSAFLRQVPITLALISMAAIAGAAISGLSLPACVFPAG